MLTIRSGKVVHVGFVARRIEFENDSATALSLAGAACAPSAALGGSAVEVAGRVSNQTRVGLLPGGRVKDLLDVETVGRGSQRVYDAALKPAADRNGPAKAECRVPDEARVGVLASVRGR